MINMLTPPSNQKGLHEIRSILNSSNFKLNQKQLLVDLNHLLKAYTYDMILTISSSLILSPYCAFSNSASATHYQMS